MAENNEKKYIIKIKGKEVSKETFTQICWEVGMSDAADFIKFESDERDRYREITEEF